MNPQALQQIGVLLNRIPPFGSDPPEGLFSTLQEAGIYLAEVKARLRTQAWLAQKVGLPGGTPEFLVDDFQQAMSLAGYERLCELLDDPKDPDETEEDEQVHRRQMKALIGMDLQKTRTVCLMLATALCAEVKLADDLKAARDEARAMVRTMLQKDPARKSEIQHLIRKAPWEVAASLN